MLYAQGPSKWPEVPEWWSYSLLREVEACPRQWALWNAIYPRIWTAHGYPKRPYIASLQGRVIHASVNEIIRFLRRCNCQSSTDPQIPSLLKEIGGYSSVIRRNILREREYFENNPRSVDYTEHVFNTLKNRVHEIREQVQTLITRVAFLGGNTMPWTGAEHTGLGTTALGIDSYSEVFIQYPEKRLRGITDLIVASASNCELIDLKTGLSHDWHVEQLWFYNLLWNYDRKVNPFKKEVSRMALYYQHGIVDIQVPTPVELAEFESRVLQRITLATAGLRQCLPYAKIDYKLCKYCGVRHLCDEYWRSWLQQKIDQPTNIMHDFELLIVEPRGSLSCKCEVIASNVLHDGTSVLLRLPRNIGEIERGQTIRVLDIFMSQSTEDSSTPILQAGVQSEFFAVD